MNAMFEKRKDEDFVRDNITPQTNADRIRAMSDEELAELLIEHHRHPCKFCLSCWADRESDDGGCREELIKFLKSEAEE